MRIDGRTRVFALLGDPVSHSLSPAMQNAAFQVLGLDAVYVALRCSDALLPSLMRALADAGGGGNVTIPHKALAARSADRTVGPLPEACNVFWGEQGALLAGNTDVLGVGQALDALEAPSTTWLVVGTGGSARAAFAAARERGARLAVRSRDPARAEQALRALEAEGVKRATEEECEVVINSTPLGLEPADPLPITPFETPKARAVLDLVYHAGGTPLVQAYAERGIRAADGREVLLAQGAAALETWFPGVSAPREVMRAAVRAALD